MGVLCVAMANPDRKNFESKHPMSDSDSPGGPSEGMLSIAGLQQLIRRMYHEKDAARGIEGTFMWFTEEVGELASALRGGSTDEQAMEFADVIAWLVTMANVAEIDLEAALMKKYGGGCPGCGRLDCVCPDAEKP
jgi:NTP pyrophosphatase (non-canonical NTP hydrolase)